MAARHTFMGLLSFLSFLTTGCESGWTTIREGSYRGTPYVVQERERSGMFSSTNSLDWRIRLGSLRAVPVNALTQDWGPPYSTDIYGTDAYLFIDTSDTAYSNAPFTPGTTGRAHTMLYISPSVLNEDQFEQFYGFMKAEWPRLSKTFGSNSLRGFPHIIGLVYGRPETYTKTFKGQHNSRPMRLTVENDGRVRLIDNTGNDTYSGIFYQVQMPGKRLLFWPGAGSGLTSAQLQQFLDERGVPITKQFTLQEIDWESAIKKGKELEELLAVKWQPPTAINSGSYLWFKGGGILEEADGNVVKPGNWSYDGVTHTLTLLNDSTRTEYSVRSIGPTELVLAQTDADTLVLHKVN